MTPNLRLYAGIAILALAFASGWAVSSWRHDSIDAAIEQAVDATREATALSAAKAIAGIVVENKNIYNKVIERTKTELVYSECRHTPEAFVIIQEAFRHD